VAWTLMSLVILVRGLRPMYEIITNGSVEMEFLKAELAVFSNAKNYRRDPLVPLVVPTVNLPHFDVIPYQRKHYGLKARWTKSVLLPCKRFLVLDIPV